MYDLLYPYQQKIFNELKDFDSCGLFMDVGCGKSITSLALADYKMAQGKVRKLIIVCLHAKMLEWKIDCEKYFPFYKVCVMDGKKKSISQFRSYDWDILIINFEKVWRTDRLINFINFETMIIVDESHKIKEHTTKVGKFMTMISQFTNYKIILTATPMGNGYIDLYNQLKFLGLMNYSYKFFEDRYCVTQLMYFPNSRPFKKVVRYKNEWELDAIVKKYCRYYQRKIDDDLVPSEIVVPIKLDKKYNKILRDRVYKDIVLDKTSRKRLGLKSLCSGTIMGKTLVDVEGNSLDRLYQLNTYKLDWVKSFIEDFKERVVIFYQYEHQRQQLEEMCKKMKRCVASYCGNIKEDNIFKENDDCVILVQYKSGATGVDWLKLSYVAIFYCLPDGYIEFKQAKGRLNRIGQTKKPLYYILVSEGTKSVDKLNYKALQENTDFNDIFFENNFEKFE